MVKMILRALKRRKGSVVTVPEAELHATIQDVRSVALFSLLILLGSVMGCAAPAVERPEGLTVSVAASVQPPFEEIAAAFTQETGIPVTLNVGATGSLAQQIASGAPVDVFAAANSEDVESLAKAGQVAADTVRPYAVGLLVIYPRAGLTISTLEDLARSDIKRVAIANPERAPYGVAAREALQAAGLWDALQDRLILAENVGQAYQYAASGNVDVALIPLALALDRHGPVQLVSADLHRPIVHALGVVATSRSPRAARAFADFVSSPAGLKILEAYGYKAPADTGE